MIPQSPLLKAAFVADALNLGPHWGYNQSMLARKFPQGISDLAAPISQYHPGKKAGDFTHYGDNMALMLRSFALTGKWNSSLYKSGWQQYWQSSSSYVDGATKETLAHLNDSNNAASRSNDSAGAAMALSLLGYLDLENESQVIEAVREQTGFTHADPETIDSAEFFTRVVLIVKKGKSLLEALDLAATVDYQNLDAASYLEKAKAALSAENHLEVAAGFGLTCHHPEAFPLVLFYLLRNGGDVVGALEENALAGGDNAARGIIIAIIITAAKGWDSRLDKHWQALNQFNQLNGYLPERVSKVRRKNLNFDNQDGTTLRATLELPEGTVRSYAIFAHCFTCGQSSRAATKITTALASQSIATLRFDFAGLGKSEGSFEETSFLTNTQDLIAAAEYLEANFEAPRLLIGHSLGGAAVLASAHAMPSVKAVATIGAPADPTHVQHLFADYVDEIEENGSAEVSLAGRVFKIGKRFLDDVKDHCQPCQIAELKRDLLILHAPDDSVVGIQNAADIYTAAKHPKSFISLTDADHLLLKKGAAEQVADLIGAWAKRSQ